MLNEPNYAAGKFLSEHSNILFKESAYYQKPLIRQSERGRPEYKPQEHIRFESL